MPEAEQPHQLFRKKRFWLLILVFPFFLTLCEVWLNSSRTVDDYLADLREHGLPTSATELNDYYAVPPNLPDTTDLWVNAVVAAGLSETEKHLSFPVNDPTPIPAPGSSWKELEAAEALISELAEELKVIRTAANSGGRARYPLDLSLGLSVTIPYSSECQKIARLLLLDAYVSAHRGNHVQASQDIIDTFALADSFAAEPTLITQLRQMRIRWLVYNAVADLLPHCDWTDEDLQQLQKAIARGSAQHAIRIALNGE